jgi:hypothetical protein
MPDRDERKLTLEVDGAAEPIAGALCDENGTTRAFAGWLGLAAALEHFLDAPSEPEAAGAEPAIQHEEVT